MKRILPIFAMAAVLASCGNGSQKSDASAADSAAEKQRQDSIAEQQRIDSIANAEEESRQFDSISEAMHAKVLSFTKGKECHTETYPPSEAWNISLPVTVTNNTDITSHPPTMSSHTARTPMKQMVTPTGATAPRAPTALKSPPEHLSL